MESFFLYRREEVKLKKLAILFVITITLIVFICSINLIGDFESSENLEVNTLEEGISVSKKIEKIPSGTWQGEISFPDWKGYVDDTLAMNSTYSFEGMKDQGRMYLNIQEEVESFDLFINNHKLDTDRAESGVFEIDISKLTKNGTNTIQVSNIISNNKNAKVTVYIPYSEVIDGTLEEVGLSKKPFELISKIIEADVEYGFASAQLAVIKDGKLVYQNAWGKTNSYNQDGSLIENGENVTNDTLYDLASNTKMYSVAYSIQYLIDNEKISLDDKIIDILGKEFSDNTIEIAFSSFKDYPGIETIKKWKSELTVLDVLMHQAGFPDSGHYHNQKFDTVNQKLVNDVDNILFVENPTKEKTLKEGIFRTPLIYKPGSKTLYSDIDYMLLGMVIEKITNKDLNSFLSEIFWKPMDLKHITYKPLENGFSKDDCAATELNGNTRDGLVDFPNVRKYIIQGEVHDEEAFYTMEGVSGHAGLFANATDLAKLAFVMLSGGYGNNKFFSKNTRDLFIAPQSRGIVSYGIGWWREADDKRVWYFGTQAPENTIGHQGWTGTITMIDFENNMVVVYLTNSINTPLSDKSSLDTANDFAGRYYTSSTLGFVPQLIYMGLDTNENDLEIALNSLLKDMVNEKQKFIENKEEKNGKKYSSEHAIIKAKEALDDVLKKW